MSKITIKEIAKELNLSVSTVSRALRDSYEISSDTKNKVLKFAKQAHYRPNPIALSLKEKKSHSICVIVPEIANNFFSEVINGIDFTAYERGYNVFIFQTHESYKREAINLENGLDRRADGFIISLSGSTSNFDHLKVLKEEGVPVVYFDRVPPFDDVHKVVVDNFEGAYKGTEYLISRGNKRIAHISSPLILSITKERIEGYKACIRDHNLPIDENMIKFCGFEPQEIYDTIKKLIEEQNPDSFIISSDRLALSALSILKEFKNSLPMNIPIVGFTNMKHASLLSPIVTTIHQPALEIGSRSANLLIDTIESKFTDVPYKKIVLKTEIQIR